MKSDWSHIRLLVLDVDGVLTDGGMWFSRDGNESKRFCARDAHGLGKLRAAGIPVVLCSTGQSPITYGRAEKWDLDARWVGVKDKASAVLEIAAVYDVSLADIAYIGDDEPDLAAFALVGFPIAVLDAEPSVLAAAHHVTNNNGGAGAVREICELILKQRVGA